MEKSKTVAFKGHRKSFPVPDTELSARLEKAVLDCYGRGQRLFLSGLDEGFDILAAEVVIGLKQTHNDIRLAAVIPFPGQPIRFDNATRMRYEGIMKWADCRKRISEHYYQGCFHRRNDFLIANATRLITAYDGSQSGGTNYTVNEAIKNGLPVNNLIQKENLMFGIRGNGITVTDRNSKVQGDYKPVAHISYDRQVEYYDSGLSLTARAQIERFARYDNCYPVSRPEHKALRPLNQ